MKQIFKISITTLMVFGLLFALACSKSDKVKLKVGQAYQGGIIAYLDATGKHGLIAAPEDQSPGIRWYNGTYIATGATGTTIGTGKDNTATIIEKQGPGNYAAQICRNLTLNGYSDWFLPSKDELNELYKNKELIGGFADEWYWSSSEVSNGIVWLQSFINGAQSNVYKNVTHRVRAVRAF